MAVNTGLEGWMAGSCFCCMGVFMSENGELRGQLMRAQ